MSTTTAEAPTGAGAPESPSTRFVLTASCAERHGVVRAVTEFIDSAGFTIDEHQQFDDPDRRQLFLRTSFSGGPATTVADLREAFAPVASGLDMTFTISGPRRPRVLVLVSREGHCLNDLVFRWRSDDLGGDLVLVASNHEILRSMAEAADLPFRHIPVTADTKAEAERELQALIEEHEVDLVVLARYMQVLSEEFVAAHAGRLINIHHSFLPGFKGARPYHQAYDRGVKYVGATAHYVTAELDEGPIIEQEVIRVTHAHGPAGLATVGRDAEALALSRAVRWHNQGRVLLNGSRTVVFP
ncbi:formyltetrahydrofolate deformylase [Rathayibacter sp. VKM Ac-2759]|uniref:formyltetrahydrofolate deformylase n=1 Tax=Rathayibacter sp. VKM Ac-2759 TaxID=2609252 RepID=UPI001316EF78|nr:formyltetrahydrofolate deformylase [Rathayibacter sp. VKM Ac-2759]QHC68055.1 formyltetrahydrofolate deformylase [Rathayibacter sp. VKM Ac-2759]